MHLTFRTVNVFVPDAGSVHIFGGSKKSATSGCSGEEGVTWVTSMTASNVAIFCYETAFSDEAVRFQLMVAFGCPLADARFGPAAGAAKLRSFNSCHNMAAFDSIAVFVKKGVTLEQAWSAPSNSSRRAGHRLL